MNIIDIFFAASYFSELVLQLQDFPTLRYIKGILP